MMPTNFDLEFAEAAQELLGSHDDSSDLGEFGEYITYHPAHTGNQGPRSIRAMVTRPNDTLLDRTANASTPNILIEIENHHVRGIDSQTLKVLNDKVWVAEIEGHDPREMTIVNILENDGSRLVLEVH